ncbi:MAG: CPBP family intramembrane metalloprotease [Bacteroidaceae bacterium]|nr:CPBP family intramembrane metalloprotease [Bacteroidaceae bacterium]
MIQSFFRCVRTSLVLCLVFVALQLAVGLVLAVVIVGAQATGSTSFTLPATYLAVALLASDVLCAWAVKAKGLIEWRQAFDVCRTPWHVAPLAFVGAVASIMAIGLATELANLPDDMAAEFQTLAQNSWGLLALCVVGPLVEEVVFRQGMIGDMRRHGAGMWMSILVSSFLFGVIHFNPIQVPFAMAMGVVLGLLYWHTGNLVMCTLLHMFNNTMTAIQTNVNPDFMLSDWLGGVAPSLACVAAGFGIAYWCFRRLKWV